MTRRRNRFRLAPTIAAVALALSMGTTALATTDPTQAVRENLDEVMEILENPALSEKPQKRMTEIREAVDDIFDWEAMARSSLGPQWRKLDASQRTEFVDLFTDLVADKYADDISKASGEEKVRIDATKERGELRIVETTIITRSREEIPVDYTLHREQDQWLIEDVTIEGVSLVNHYRSSFQRFLVNRSFDELLARLKSKRR